MIILKHVEDSLPQELQILIRESGRLPGKVGGDIALAAVETIGDDVFAAHLGAFLFCVRLGGDGNAGDGDLLRDNGLNAAGEAQLHRAAHLTAVERGFDKGGHYRAKGADVVEVGTHPVPNLPVQIGIGLFLLFHRLLVNIQRLVGFGIVPVQGYAVLDIDTPAGGVLFYGFHIVADLPLQTHVGNDAQTGLRVYAGHVAGVRIAVGVAVLHVKQNNEFIAVFDRCGHVSSPPFSDSGPAFGGSSPAGTSPAGADSYGRDNFLRSESIAPRAAFHRR